MNSQIDASIPVLTEIIPLDFDDNQPAVPDAQAFASFSPPVANSVANSAANNAAISATFSDTTPSLTSITAHQHALPISAEELKILEQNLHEAVLRQVFSRIDFVLEHRVRDNLADVLQTSVERLADEIRSGLHNTLDDIVTRAITQEISKIKSNLLGDG